MITTETPIGEIINFLYNNEKLFKNKVLSRKIKNLMDLINLRVKKDGVAYTLKSVEDNLFKIRLDIINDNQISKEITKNLNNTIQERINFQFSQNTSQKKLELAFIKSLSIYGEIVKNISDKLSQNTFSSIKKANQIDYNNFKDLLKSLPGKENQYIISYLNSSIALDFAFILSEQIFDNKLKLNKIEIENLISLLKNAIEDYAVYSCYFGSWEPSDDDESQWIRNIKIRISLFESKFQSDLDSKLSSNEIKKIIIAE